MAKVDKMKDTKKIRLFKDNGEYKDDLFVCVNGQSYLIQRGIEVEVPVAVANVIERSYESDIMISNILSKKEEEFSKIK